MQTPQGSTVELPSETDMRHHTLNNEDFQVVFIPTTQQHNEPLPGLKSKGS